MNRSIKSIASVLLAVSTLTFFSCDNESDIIGLNEATKYGFIKVTLEGTRPDGEEYELTRTFKFASSTGPEYSSTVSTGQDRDIYRNFNVVRYAGAINESGDGESNQATLYFYTQEDAETGELVYTAGDLELETPVVTEDKQFFSVNEYIEIESEDVTDYKYNDGTGKLSYKFTKQLTSQQTNSGYPLKITVAVNVTVFEYLNSQFD